MKYLFKFLAYMLAFIFWPITAGWDWLILYGDRAWCWVWHLGHDWIDIQYPNDYGIPNPKPPIWWCSRCHLRKDPRP